MKKTNHLQAFIWSILGYLISSLNDLLTKISGISFSPHEVIFFRFLFSLIILLPFLIKQRSQSSNLSKENHIIHAIRGLIWTIGILLWTYNASKLPLYIVTISSFLIPLFNLILSKIFLKEKIIKKNIILNIISFLGVLTIFHISSFSIINFFSLIVAALMFSSLDVLNKKIISENNSIISTIFFSNLYSLFIVSPFLLIEYIQPTLKEFLFLFLLGLGASLLIFCILKSFSKIQLSSIQYVRYLEFPISCILSFIVFNEKPTFLVLIGCLVVIFANLLSFKINIIESKD